jgi:hypothetical protein
MECAAHLDVMKLDELVERELYERGVDMLERIWPCSRSLAIRDRRTASNTFTMFVPVPERGHHHGRGQGQGHVHGHDQELVSVSPRCCGLASAWVPRLVG